MSNFDTHGFTIHPIFLAKAMHKRPLWANVPLRAMLPQGLEGVMVTGLGISCHRDALPVTGYAAAMALAEAVQAAAWDAGWNSTGMGQFGMSASPVDALVIALGSCGGAEAVPALIGKIAQRDGVPAADCPPPPAGDPRGYVRVRHSRPRGVRRRPGSQMR